MQKACWAIIAASALGACAGPIATSIPIDFSATTTEGALAEAIEKREVRQVYALPRTFMRILVVAASRESRTGTFVVDASTDLVDFPDARHVYAIRHNSSFWSDDDLTFEVSADHHYLTAVKTKASDRSLDIARLAGTAILRATTGVRDARIGSPKSERSGAATDQVLFEDIIDPTVPGEVTRVNELMAPFCVRIEVRSPDGETLQASPAVDAATTDGILYRVRLPYKVNYFENTCAAARAPGEGERLGASILLLSSNQSRVIPLPLERALFVETVQNYVFGGTNKVNSSSISQPSAALSFMQLPLDIVDAILNVPIAAIKQLYTDDKAIAEQEKAAYEAQLGAIEARIRLLDMESRLKQGPQAPQTPADGPDKLSNPASGP